MYLYLSPAISQSTTVHYQSLGREILTVSNLKVLENLKVHSIVLIFYDNTLDIQKLIDLYCLLDLQFIIIIKRREDENIFDNIFKVYFVDYKIIDGRLIQAIKTNDLVSLSNLQKCPYDTSSILYKQDYFIELDKFILSNNFIKDLVNNYKNLYSVHQELNNRFKIIGDKEDEREKEVFSLRQSLKQTVIEMKSFLKYFTNLQNKYKSITALAVLKDLSNIVIPSNLMSLYMKDYGIPNLFTFIHVLEDTLTVEYKRYVKVIYVCEPDGISINRIPDKYIIVNNEVYKSDLVISNYIALVGNVNIPLEFIFNSSSFNTLILIDGRRVQEKIVSGETMFLNLAPDYDTQQRLGLNENITVTPSNKSKYQLKEDSINQNSVCGLRNLKIIVELINTLMEKWGNI